MTCAETREMLVVADLRDLANETSDLAVHVRDCDQCRTEAAAIAAQTVLLGSRVRSRARRRGTRRFVLAAALPVAAVALLAVSFRDRRGAPPHAPQPTRALSSLPVARHVSLTVGPGQSATVLATADTTVTVIWFTGAGQ